MSELHHPAEMSDEVTPLQSQPASGTSTPLGARRHVKKILVHQMSSLELPVDRSGMVKLHYWY